MKWSDAPVKEDKKGLEWEGKTLRVNSYDLASLVESLGELEIGEIFKKAGMGMDR